MEKYARVLVIIFFLILFNLGLNFYILSKLNKPIEKPVISVVKPSPTSTSGPVTKNIEVNEVKSDLNLIKAEIRALRDALDVTGLILETPAP